MKVKRKKGLPVMLVDGVRYRAKPEDGDLYTCPACAFYKASMYAACGEAPCMDPNVYFVKAKKGPWIAAEGRNPRLAKTVVVEWENSAGLRDECLAGELTWGGSTPVVRYRVFQKD